MLTTNDYSLTTGYKRKRRMKKKEHIEVLLEDVNSKLDLVFENFQSLGDKIDQNKFDSDKRNDETNKLLKFAYDDLDKKIQGNGLKIEQNSNLIKENKTLIKENSKKIENNGTKIEENKKLIKENGNLIEENGKKFEILREKQHNYEEKLILLEKK